MTEIAPEHAEPAHRPRGIFANARWDWPTLVLLLGCFAAWAVVLIWPMGLVGFVVLVLALVLHASVTHELLHGHPVKSSAVTTALGCVQLGLVIPYLRFKHTHLAHHRDALLTDPYDDPETNYLDPAVWQLLRPWQRRVYLFNNTLAGRMLIGPVLGTWAFLRSDGRAIRAGDRQVAMDWLVHLPGVALVCACVWMSPLSGWTYAAACYGALSVLKIRTFLEHRAHPHAASRTVIVEKQCPLAFLFLNNSLHVVHHMHPDVPWYRLPAFYAAKRARYVARNDGYVYPSYAAIFKAYLWRRKDPVAHPLWASGPPDRTTGI